MDAIGSGWCTGAGDERAEARVVRRLAEREPLRRRFVAQDGVSDDGGVVVTRSRDEDWSTPCRDSDLVAVVVGEMDREVHRLLDVNR